jgi:hypothetical protein
VSEEAVSLVVGTFADGTVWGAIVDDGTTSPVAEQEYKGPGESPVFVAADDGSNFDILIPYTQEAMCAEAGEASSTCPNTDINRAPIETRINMLVSEANAVLSNSGFPASAPTSFNLVHTYMVEDYSEGGSFSDTLDQMKTPNDGVFETPSLLGVRDQFCADLIGLIVLNSDPNGILGQAAEIGPNPDGFSMVSSLEVTSLASLV